MLLSDDLVRRMRTAAQLLHRTSRSTAAELVGYLTGVQAQVLSAAGLALRARTNGLTAEGVDHARLHNRSVVLTWVMRGTLHLIASEDHAWLVPLTTEPGLANAHRRLKQEGVSDAQAAKALPLISQMLGREGPLTRAEIADRLQRKGIPTKGQAIAHLVWMAAAQGTICYGPDRGGDKCFVLVNDWVPRSKPRERDASLAELAIRYMRSHAPAQPADLAYWSGIRAGDATRAWKAIAANLVEVETVRGTRWVLKGDLLATPLSPTLSPEGEREMLPRVLTHSPEGEREMWPRVLTHSPEGEREMLPRVLTHSPEGEREMLPRVLTHSPGGDREMLPRVLSHSPGGDRERVVRLLPAFDEYLLGWKDRYVAVAVEHLIKINRGGGWLHPVLLVDGQVVATWRMTKGSKGSRLEVSPFAPLISTVKRAIAKEAEDIAAFVGAPLEVGS